MQKKVVLYLLAKNKKLHVDCQLVLSQIKNKGRSIISQARFKSMDEDLIENR